MKKIFTLILCCLALGASGQQKEIALSDIFQNGSFRAEGVAGFNSMKDGKYYTDIDEKGNLIKKSFATGETAGVLVKADELKDKDGESIPLGNYTFSDDETKILINTDIEHIYRRSYKAFVYVYDLGTKKLYKISEDKLLHATLSPDGSRVAYVKDNNLFYKDLASGKITQVTADGKQNSIINGNCDWVYEEEFEFTRAFEWSPDGDHIAYYRFDESRVPEYSFDVYKGLYPTEYKYKYPKAGEANSVITIHVYDLKTGANRVMDTGPDTDQYLPRIKWTTSDDTLCIYRMNRLQNKMELLLTDIRTGKYHTLFTEKDNWYIDEGLLDDVFFLKDRKHFILMDEQDGWQHAYLYDMQGKLVSRLTPGNYDVDKIAAIDEKNRLLYYTSAEYSPMDRQLWVVDFTGKNKKQLTAERGWHNADFSADASYFVDNYSNINTPPVINLCDNTGNIIRNLKDNQALKTVMSGYNLSKAEFLKVPNSQGVELNAWILKPPHFDTGKKYPVLFMNYGGPGSQTVTDRWGAVNFWQQLLAEKGYIIVSMDNTGTGFRGEVFKKKSTYLKLGWQEIHDQMDAARYLAQHFSYVDANRIGHWGWSFGGFMSSLAITVGAAVFHTAIAVAPVTNWRYYDNIYTERYMRTPKENPDGYKESSPITYADSLKGKFLLIHGTGDDNVHFQNSIMFSEALIQDNKQFQQAYYPNKNHGIYGGNTTIQLYTRMTDFILGNL